MSPLNNPAMKKLPSLLVIALFLSLNSISQTIVSISMTPANPNSNDSIQIIVEEMFPSGGCEGTAYHSVNGNVINADALHCLGQLTVICTDYDTINLAPLNAGLYLFVFTLSTGQGIPCSPGIVPDDVDTLIFTVDNGTGIINTKYDIPFSIISNPGTDKFIIRNNTGETGLLRIFSSEGKPVHSQAFINSELTLENPLSPGFYIVVAESKNRRYTSKLVLIN